MKVLNQPYEGTLGDIIISQLQSQYNSFTMVSAYAKMSGISRLQPHIENFRSNGGTVRSFIGIDQKNTSYEALVQLLHLSNEFYVIHSENLSHTFHPKFYIFQSENSSWVSIGSNNLTSGGLWTNYETSMYYDYNHTNPEHSIEFSKLIELLDRFASYDYQYSMKINNIEDINQLLEQRYILRETELTSRLINVTNTIREDRTRLFGTETFNAPARPTADVQTVSELEEIPVRTSNEPNSITQGTPTIQSTPILPLGNYETFWFEMRASTGGSRNILDLSKIGKIIEGSAVGTPYSLDNSQHMLGGAAFFDIDPNDHKIVKHITINFEGLDYYPSTILFADNNGSWRLQLKGGNSTSTHALSSFGRTKFIHNILVFEKIATDYYILFVVDGNYISDLRAKSKVYARNGSNPNSKQYGML